MKETKICWRIKDSQKGQIFAEGYLDKRLGVLVSIKDREFSIPRWYREDELEIVKIDGEAK